MSYTGIPVEEVSLSCHVGFRDLDLTTPAGKDELDKRIKAVATEACNQIQKLYSLEQWDTDTRTCIVDAIKDAMAQEQTIFASALRKYWHTRRAPHDCASDRNDRSRFHPALDP